MGKGTSSPNEAGQDTERQICGPMVPKKTVIKDSALEAIVSDMRALGVLVLRRGDVHIQLDPQWVQPVDMRAPKPDRRRTATDAVVELEAERRRQDNRGLRGVLRPRRAQ